MAERGYRLRASGSRGAGGADFGGGGAGVELDLAGDRFPRGAGAGGGAGRVERDVGFDERAVEGRELGLGELAGAEEAISERDRVDPAPAADVRQEVRQLLVAAALGVVRGAGRFVALPLLRAPRLRLSLLRQREIGERDEDDVAAAE